VFESVFNDITRLGILQLYDKSVNKFISIRQILYLCSLRLQVSYHLEMP
jgi:hypothetical protein